MKRFLGIVLKLLFLCVIGILIGFIIFFLDYENIEKNGEYKYFYEYKTYSGKNRQLPESIRSYKDNKLEGKYVSFHYTGEYESVKPKVFYRTPKWYKPVVKSLGTFKQNKKEGTWNYYFENNQLHKHGSYKNGLKEGPWNYYFDESEEEQYSEGSMNDNSHDQDPIIEIEENNVNDFEVNNNDVLSRSNEEELTKSIADIVLCQPCNEDETKNLITSNNISTPRKLPSYQEASDVIGSATPRYLLDITLNKLTRWLRILGIDAELESGEEEKARTSNGQT